MTQTTNKKTVEATTIHGEPRTYTFLLMDAATGLEIFHERDFTSLMLAACEMVKACTPTADNDQDVPEPDGMAALALAGMFSGIVTWEQAKELSRNMLAGATVAADLGNGIKSTTIRDDGLCHYADGDPLEQYLALSHAMLANYPKYTSFFEGVLADDTSKENDVETDEDQTSTNTH